MSRYLINIPPIGGLSTQIYTGLAIILQNEINLSEIESFKFNCLANWYDNNVFDNIFDYDNSHEYVPIDGFTIENGNKVFGNINRDMYCSVHDPTFNFDKLQYLINLNKIKPEVEDIISNYIDKYNINSSTLGVHIRLTDMDIMHKAAYGKRCYENYIDKILSIISINKSIKNIFIASDNYESIDKIKNDIKSIDVNYIEDIYRNDKEKSDNYVEQMNRSRDKKYIIDNFIDMYLLSKCGYLIHRISGFSYCSILYSKTIKNRYLI